ncbi:bacterio-opsin activator HTH domain-containing protein [Halogeometricum pallidum JCM 14848]|uniref:Bacterio-opsin activator HTH domain-containing protein n=1 Tax=Halogeometricum pallidum JCM 14848 TaxID=1227487 RepID=M0D9X1_HALPD|nr:helix-turn-helix domain-containing protein [Halogeometricum pallidum]ELZ30954.1 bacterio-opsin activator HTH domain-containing protein [Halogeometricum pallidum JCM 14848]
MTALLDFGISSDEFVLGRLLDVDAVHRIEFTPFVPVGDGFIPYIWVTTDDHEVFESTVLDSPCVAAFQKLDGARGPTLYRIEWTERLDGLLDILQAHDLAVLQAKTTGSEWRFTLLAESRDVFETFQTHCHRGGFPITVKRLSNSDDRDGLLYGLTEKQRDALLLVFEAGYYTDGENVTLAELSERLDISQQALSARIRRGTSTLISNTIALD